MDTTGWVEESNDTKVISSDGDIVLVVGPGQSRLRVQSQCLMWASSVFVAMFNRQWAEGQANPDNHPRDIDMMEDDAGAIRTICCVIHHRSDMVIGTIKPEEVLQIAIASDKYDLGIALKYASRQWLYPQSWLNMMDRGLLIAAAFLFYDEARFTTLTMELLLHYKDSYVNILENTIVSEIIPIKMLHLLEERRTKMRAELYQILIEEATADTKWEADGSRSENYRMLMQDYRPVRMLDVPISTIAIDMGATTNGLMNYLSHRGKSSRFHDDMLKRLDLLKTRASICLNCARYDIDEMPCNHDHQIETSWERPYPVFGDTYTSGGSDW